MGIVIAILIFGIIVTVHEFGHFICAKLSGVKVNEFSVGMGPRILKFGKGETAYSLRILPVGGYCAMEGEDEAVESKRGFRSQKVWKRMIILFAGAFMNFVLGLVLTVIMTCMGEAVPTMEINNFSRIINEDESIEYCAESYKSGLRQGDVIKEIDGMHIFSLTDLNYLFGQSNTHDMEVERNGERIILEDVKFGDEQFGGLIDFSLVYEEKNVLNVISYAAKDAISLGRLVWTSLVDLVTGKYSASDLSGPVGVVSVINDTAQQGETVSETVEYLLYLSALITINLGVFNLLPIPGLDGGRLLFCFIEIIRRKPVKAEHEAYVHLAGMALLFAIMIFATYQDILRLITG